MCVTPIPVTDLGLIPRSESWLCVFFFLAVVGIVPQWSIHCPRILLLSFLDKRLDEVFIQWVCQEEIVYSLCP